MVNGNYVVLKSFMINKLKLKGNELIVYAIIFNFTAGGVTDGFDDLEYLAGWISSSKKQAAAALQRLVDKRLVKKTEVEDKGCKRFCYKVVF